MKTNKLLFVLFAITVCVTTVFFTSYEYNMDIKAATLAENKDTVRGLESDLKSIQSSLTQIQASINKAQQNQADQITIKSQLDREIELATQEIDVLNKLIEGYQTQIEEKETQISQKDKNIEDTIQSIADRLVMQHESSSGNIINYILGSDDFADLLTRIEITSALFEYDRMMIENLSNERLSLSILKDELSSTLTKCDESVAELEAKKGELDGKISVAESYLAQYMADEKNARKEYETKSKELDDIANEIKNLLAEIALQERTNYSGEEFIFPMESYRRMSSAFGWRTWSDGSREYHKGVDFSAERGTPILASNSGTVILHRNSPSFGLYLIIDHGGGVTSLYAHCSKLLVSTGDVVLKGDKIAEVGSTGWSTGNHLHFAILENGEYVDPMGYIKLITATQSY